MTTAEDTAITIETTADDAVATRIYEVGYNPDSC
jgi:hypothetical protein